MFVEQKVLEQNSWMEGTPSPTKSAFLVPHTRQHLRPVSTQLRFHSDKQLQSTEIDLKNKHTKKYFFFKQNCFENLLILINIPLWLNCQTEKEHRVPTLFQ